MLPPAGLAALAASLLVATAATGASSGDPLAPFRDKARVLVALAPSASDPGLVEQRRLFAAMGPDAAARDLVMVEAADEGARSAALRRRFGAGSGFKAVLVGKDGGEKLASAVPLGPDDLFPLIDAMPMRRREMRRP